MEAESVVEERGRETGDRTGQKLQAEGQTESKQPSRLFHSIHKLDA